MICYGTERALQFTNFFKVPVGPEIQDFIDKGWSIEIFEGANADEIKSKYIEWVNEQRIKNKESVRKRILRGFKEAEEGTLYADLEFVCIQLDDLECDCREETESPFLNEFMKDWQNGDFLCRYASPQKHWDFMFGEAGYGVVRDGKMIRNCMTAEN
jgi:hypothetical protein